MSQQVGRITDIIGAALILGILLRWGDPASKLIAAVGSTFNSAYHEVSLQGIKAPGEA